MVLLAGVSAYSLFVSVPLALRLFTTGVLSAVPALIQAAGTMTIVVLFALWIYRYRSDPDRVVLRATTALALVCAIVYISSLK